MARKRKVKFSDKKHSVKGITSLIIGIISITLLMVLFYFSALVDGRGGTSLGIIGMLILIFSITGFVLGYQAYKEKDIFYGAPIVGTILNGLNFLVMFLLYTIGLLL